MKELDDGSWQINSAFEALVVGRAATRNHTDGATLILFKHPGETTMPATENEFLTREAEHQDSPLVIHPSYAQVAEGAFRHIVATRESWNDIDPTIANAFLEVIDETRAATTGKQETERLRQLSSEDVAATGRRALELAGRVRSTMHDMPPLDRRPTAA